MRTEEQKRRSRENARRFRERHPNAAREANRRWKERHPDKVAEANRRPRHRIYDPVKTKEWRERRLSDPAYRARLNLQANERATALRRWLDEHKLASGCVDCGYREHPAALHFDHVNGEKRLNVCNAKSIAQAEREIAKCEVRCANCHSIRSFERLQQGRMSPGKSRP